MTPRRILIFSLVYSPFWGGAELAVKEITDRISSSEIAFDMVTLRADARLPRVETIGNVTVYRIGPSKKGMMPAQLMAFPWYLIKVLYPILAVLKARELHKKNHYDLMWCLMTNMGFPAVLARMVGVNIPFVLTLQDGDTIEHITARWRIRLFSPLLKKIFRDAIQVQVISNYLGAFATQMGFRGEPILVPNGVDISRFTQMNQKEVDSIKQTLHKKDDELFLVTTSRLVEKNGLEDVIRALPSIPNTRFLILGEGPLREHLEHVVRETNMSDRVVFLGHVAHEHLPAYLHASDIFIRPSLSEGLGSSFLEAMAAGLPVIATPVGGIPDFLFDIEEHGENATGIFCQPHNPESIAFAVKRLTQDVGMRQHIAANGSNLVLKNYDWDDIAQRIKKILGQFEKTRN